MGYMVWLGKKKFADKPKMCTWPKKNQKALAKEILKAHLNCGGAQTLMLGSALRYWSVPTESPHKVNGINFPSASEWAILKRVHQGDQLALFQATYNPKIKSHKNLIGPKPRSLAHYSPITRQVIEENFLEAPPVFLSEPQNSLRKTRGTSRNYRHQK